MNPVAAEPGHVVREFSETVALVTGGTSGIGLETALQLVDAGVRQIALNGRDPVRGQAAVAQVRQRAPGVACQFFAASVDRADESARMVAEVEQSFGRIDLLVAAAGGNHAPCLFHEIPQEALQGIVTAYLMGSMHCARAALPGMMNRQGGCIVVIASDAAKVPTPGESVIGAAMAAQAMFVRTLAMEARRHGVRVNCLTPSLVRDTRTYDLVMSTEFSRRLFTKAAKRAMLGVSTPADQAALIVYLASPAAARMTGQVISINGGISAG